MIPPETLTERPVFFPLKNDFFAKLDQTGVGKRMKMAIELGKPVNPNMTLGSFVPCITGCFDIF